MAENGDPIKASDASALQADPLAKYRRKRGAGNTNEPYAAVVSTSSQECRTWRGEFVVHLHNATRRHYDLRIQVGNTLASFAVPRGPSLDPAEKRLAVQTENHPLEYLYFEDVIPAGNYGAGPMIIWDIGRVQYLEQSIEEGLAKGKIDFVLQGKKLHGRFALVDTTDRRKPRPQQRQWLLIKKSDLFTREIELAVEHGEQPHEPVEMEPESCYSGLRVEQLEQRQQLEKALILQAKRLGSTDAQQDWLSTTPMLCGKEGATLADPRRLYELKLDGVRILAERSSQLSSPGVRLKYRSGRAATQSYPEVARALGTLFATDFVVDGEIVAYDERGKPQFQRLLHRIQARRYKDVRRARFEVPVHYLVFDLLRLGRQELSHLPLVDRKALLARLLPGKGIVRFLDHIEGSGEELFSLCRREGLEGVVSKRKAGPYIPGPQRSADWVKHKCEQQAAFVVVGWVEGKGSRGPVGALELASYDCTVEPPKLRYRGRVGTGMDARTLSWLAAELAGMRCEVCAVDDLSEDGRKVFLVEPRLVVNVRFLEWTGEGRIRMGVYLGVERELSPYDCHVGPEPERKSADWVDDPEVPEEPLSEFVASGARSRSDSKKVVIGERRRVVLSNQSKVFWPAEGYTKGDLLAYYQAVSSVLLPLLEDRPVMLVRYPDGMRGKSFYQWNVPPGTPTWMKTLQLKQESKDTKSRASFVIDSIDSLLHVINLGCIPLHVLASRRGSLDHCDFITIDFDLGDNPFQEAVRLALCLQELLDDLGLLGFPKTSGQTGLHVLVPLGPGISFKVAKTLVELIGRLVQAQFGETATMERRVAERGGRVYIDIGQTGRSRTIVAPYSVRAYPGARVSTPLSWEEVHLALRPEVFTLSTVPERVVHCNPYAGLLEQRPDVGTLLTKLERWLR